MVDALHLSPDELELWLDGGLPTARTSHLETCEQCRTAAEDLREIVTQLEALPELAPRASLADAVMARVALPSPAAAHLTDAQLDDWVLGALAPEQEAHLHACAACRATADRERLLVLALERLPLLTPSARFTDRVMAEVELPVTSIRTAYLHWKRGVSRDPMAAGLAAGIGGLLGGSIAASLAWSSGHMDLIQGTGSWLLTHGQALFWQGVGFASSLLEQQAWYPVVRAQLTPGRALAAAGVAVSLWAAGVVALRRLIALPSPGAARALP